MNRDCENSGNILSEKKEGGQQSPFLLKKSFPRDIFILLKRLVGKEDWTLVNFVIHD